MDAAIPLSAPPLPDLLARARRLAPVLASRIPEAARLRRIPDATMADLHDAGFFRVVRPHRYGGYETSPVAIYEIQLELARACASTAWVYGVLNVHSWQLALFPEEAQDEVWHERPDALIASSYMPVGRVTRVRGGGVRLSGRWSFSSGSDHCDWVMLGGFVPPEDGEGAPEMRTFLLPKSDYHLVDTWHVTGLVATGSKDVVVDDAFVPEHRMHRFSDGYRQKSPGNDANPSPIYRFPFGQIHVRCVSTPAVGAAFGALEAFRAMGPELPTSDESGHAAMTTRIAAARGAAALDREVLALRRDFDSMTRSIEAGEPLSIEDRARYRHDAASAVSTAVEVVDGLFTMAGRAALRSDHPLNRAFQDVHAIRAHHANGFEKPAANFGGVLLGEKSTDYFL